MTLVEYPKMEQRSPEWFEARRGIVTASIVGKLLTTEGADPLEFECTDCTATVGISCMNLRTRQPIKSIHDARQKLAAAEPARLVVADNDTSRGIVTMLAAERISGITEETPINSDMWRGIEHEPFARDHYSGHYQQASECGFVRRDETGWTLGLSPDGLVGDEGGLELKCPRQKTHVAWTVADQVPAQHMPQVQAALLVTGRAWWDFASFCGGFPLFVKRVTPDPIWFAAIEAACRAFETNVTALVSDYQTKTKGLPISERVELISEIQVA